MIVFDAEQQSEEWHLSRSGRPSASGFDRIADGNGNKADPKTWAKYARDLTAEAVAPLAGGFRGNYNTRRGNELEPVARAEFERLTGLDVQQVGFITRDDGIIGCSPDGIVVDQRGNWIAGLEIKCPLRETHAEYLERGVLPPEYKQQVHGGMCVTGLSTWYFVSYHPGMRTLLLEIKHDAFTARLSTTLDEFLMFYRARHAELLPKFKPEATT